MAELPGTPATLKVSLAYTEDSKWRNRDEFFQGREVIRDFLKRKWARELDYRLERTSGARTPWGASSRRRRTLQQWRTTRRCPCSSGGSEIAKRRCAP